MVLAIHFGHRYIYIYIYLMFTYTSAKEIYGQGGTGVYHEPGTKIMAHD